MSSEAWRGFLGQKWAASWPMTDRTFAGLTERMEQLCFLAPVARVLDAGCGAGEFAIRLANAQSGLYVAGVDISAELVEQARQRTDENLDVHFSCDDVTRWHPQDGRLFDLIVARHVIMFFDDPQEALRHLASLAAPQGRLIFSCFRSNAENGWIADILGQLPERFRSRLRSDQPGPLAFADMDWVKQLLTGAGWPCIEFEAFDYGMAVGGGADPLGDAVAYLLNIGPASFAATEFTPQELDEFVDRLRRVLEGYLREGEVRLPAATWIVSGLSAAEPKPIHEELRYCG